MRKNTDTEIIIIGAGMAGLTLAGLVAKGGRTVTVIDRIYPRIMASEKFDSRTVALSAGTRAVLAPLGVWDKLAALGTAITQIDVQEGHDPFILNFDTDDVAVEAFGWIMPNDAVRGALYRACVDCGVTFISGAGLETFTADDTRITATLDNGQQVTAQLLIGADGRQSRVRALLGIPVVAWDYHHTALVGLIEHDQPHHGLALERFYPSGPFAALPFTDNQNGAHRSAVVWSRHARDIKRDPVDWHDHDALTAALTPMLDARYGTIRSVDTWAAYPLSLCHAKEMVGPRVALISDAAHGIHPIAGQGLNLGMRDIAWLAGHIGDTHDDIGSADFLNQYERARRFDVFAMVAATDVLTRLFGSRIKPVRWARSLGLGLVQNIPPLKRFFMRQAMGQ